MEWARSADFRASNYRMEFGGTSYQLDARGKSYLVRVPLIGRFNVANSLAALAAANALGIESARSGSQPGKIAAGARAGFEAVPAKRQFQVFVDYAHTPDALLNVLKTLRELQPRRLIVVFGCGGDRDRQKRPLMAQVVDQNADHAIITSDNPRKEDPRDDHRRGRERISLGSLRKDRRSRGSDRPRHRAGRSRATLC